MIKDILESSSGARSFPARLPNNWGTKPHSTEDALQLLGPTLRRLSEFYAGGDGELKRDLFQTGVVGLLGAFERYDGQRGASFKTFANRYIRGSMLNYLRDQPPAMESLDAPGVEMDDSDSDELRDIEDEVASRRAREQMEWLFIKDAIASVIGELSDRQAQAFDLFTHGGLGTSEIARKMGVSAPRVSAVLSAIVARIRERLRLC